MKKKRTSFFSAIFLIWVLVGFQTGYSANRRPRVFNIRTRAVRIVNEFAEVIRQLPEFKIRVEVVKYNRTLPPVLNFECVVHDTKFLNYKVWIDGYEKYGMEHIYRRSAISLHCTYCDLLAGSVIFPRTSLEEFDNNFPSKCPLKLDKLYYFRNFHINEKLAPPTFPGYKWRIDMQFGPEGKKDTNGTALLQYYFRVEWYDRESSTKQ